MLTQRWFVSLLVGILVIGMLCFMWFISTTSPRLSSTPIMPLLAQHRLFAKRNHSESCEDLDVHDDMASNHSEALEKFLRAVKKSLNETDGKAAGHTYNVPRQFQTLHYLASMPWVRTACETGFNLGHSSFNFLEANKRLSMHSFDIGEYAAGRRQEAYLTSNYPGRFQLHIGDSRVALPEFARANPDFRCDLMWVDADHSTDAVKQDLRNFAQMANLPNNIIAADDTEDYPNLKAGAGWHYAIQQGFIVELMRCRFTMAHRGSRGFAIGVVVRRP